MKTSLPQAARVVSGFDESPKVRTLTLDLHLQAEPGQFVMAWLPGLDEKPFSLVHADPVTLTIARIGPFSEAIHRLSAGDPIWLVSSEVAGLLLIFTGVFILALSTSRYLRFKKQISSEETVEVGSLRGHWILVGALGATCVLLCFYLVRVFLE